jgi:tritrans,polycis-undecaprenyl-diphosphate synthase [geranylgeranyl-diphosphate specific]
VAIIMDGNRRFALASGLPQRDGHRRGKEKVREVMRWCRDLGIHYLTVYALSTENLTSRSPEELATLFDLYEAGFLELAADREIHQDQVRCQAVGQLHLLPSRVVQAIAVATQATQAYNALVFTVCLAYGARQELVDAIKGILLDHTNGKLSLEDICEERVAQYLYTSGMPDPDLVIRTSGEERVSNFLLWQLVYAELCFIDVYWPAFRKRDFLRAIRTYQGRHRRHGA